MKIDEGDYLFHIGNAGIILKLGDIIIGIDIFTGVDISPYEASPVELERDLLYNKRYPELDVLVITHNHKDHFNIGKVTTYIKHHASTAILAGQDVINKLRESGIKSQRLLAKQKLPNGDYCCSCGGMELDYLSTIHMGQAYRDVQHYSLLIRYNNQGIFISGDAAPDNILYEHLKEYCKSIRILIAPFPVAGLTSARKILLQYFRPEQIFLMHFPEPGQDKEGWIESTLQICKKAIDALPNPVYCFEAGGVYPLILN